MELPGHIIDLVCSLDEQDVSDNDIIRWCLILIDNPRGASLATAFLEMGDRTNSDVHEMFNSLPTEA